jgi:cyclopropane fatty-acyl-phospholipid synthase-like methyltransferase
MSTANWQGFWDGKTDGGHRSQEEAFLAKEAREKLFHIGEVENLLDFGCGSGDLTKYYADAIPRVVGADFSETMLAGARKRLPNVPLHCADDVTIWSKLTETFDVITVAGVLQYMKLWQAERFVGNARAHLAPGGRIVLFDIIDPRIYALVEMGLFPDKSFPSPRGFASAAVNALFPSRRTIGYPHHPRDVKAAAASVGFATEIVWSMFYEYRYHAICQPVA